jgi:hypothetical protein
VPARPAPAIEGPSAPEELPELAAVRWRPRASARSIAARGRLWTLWSLAHTVPFAAVGVFLLYIEPWSAPVALAAFAHAWIIPELYAARGAAVVRPKGRGDHPSQTVAQGFLGDLLGHEERELQRRTGLALEPGALGTWLVGEAGALLVAPGSRRVHCFCVRVPDPDLPPSDRVAHLLLALRTDEAGFATVANHAFAGAPWRIRRRIIPGARPALAAGRERARGGRSPAATGTTRRVLQA